MIMTRHIKRLVVNSLLIGSALCAYPATVSVDDARAIAAEFMRARSGALSGELEVAPVYKAGTESKPLYYVFNAVGDAGFVIISAEDATAPVLGYSFESAYPVASQPDALKWVMAGIEREIKAAPTLQSSNSLDQIKRMARAAAHHANGQKQLATPAWSQEAPFNSMIPGQPLVGCVGTAMATIMKYHNWPEQGTGSFDGVDFGVAYDWDSMRADNYRSGYTSAEAEAVATIMYHASKSIDTQYAMSGSSAYEVRVPGALSAYFGYDPGVSYKKRAEVATQADWDNIVINEINEGRPVLYCGQDVTAGHAFVCDGYQGEYLHFNWGWGGAANGYFLSTALNPTVSRTHHYNNLNTIIYNIKPATGSTEWSPIHITSDGNQVGLGSDLTDLSSGKKFTVRAGNLKNLSYSDFSGKIAVALCDAHGSVKALLSAPSNFSLQSMATLFNGYVEFGDCSLPGATLVSDGDRVRLVTQASGADTWLPVAGELPTQNELAPTVESPASFAITLPTGTAGVNVIGQDNVIRGWDYTFKVVPENPDAVVVTVKANGYVLTPNNEYSYTIINVREDQTVTALVQNVADVKEKRSVWVDTPGTLSSVISEEESGVIKELTLFGTLDARDFAFMKNSMRLSRVDLSGVTIVAHGSDQANAIPREAFRGVGTLNEVVLPSSINRLNNGCFRQCGITTISIPAGVKTYEYNVFVGASRLRDIYVGRETAEFINWCVLSGVKVAEVTLHVPTQTAVSNYQNAENWNTIGKIIVGKAPENTNPMFAVMDNSEVKFDCATLGGPVEKGTEISFTASHIADNDNKMEVYANHTLLTPDADGVYKTTVNNNTIIHFDMVAPIEVSGKSPWTLTDKNGSIGLLTDAVNVIPGQDFTIRVNAMNIPRDLDQMFWAAALTDALGNIKEFISPVTLWTAGPADNHKFNVNCRVNDSKVREGNTIRIVTSAMKKTWSVVNGASDDIVAAIPALNNQTEIYNIKLNVKGSANVSGLPETAVRGRDVTMNITPASGAHRINLKINDNLVASAAASINRTFVVMEDTDIDVEVFDPREGGVVTINVSPGTLHERLTASNVCETVVVVGEVYSFDLQAATGKDFALSTIKTLDLRGVKIVKDGGYEENVINHPFFVYTNGMATPASSVESILLPDNVVRIAGGVFKNCAKIKEITLPLDLVSQPILGTYASGSTKYTYGLADEAFKGCDNLTTIRIPGAPSEYNGRLVVAHHHPYASTGSQYYSYYNLGHADPKKVTVIVPEEFLSVYTTPYNNLYYGNPWKAHGYNILSEDPVYGVNFDASRVAPVDTDMDITKMAVFLGDNVSLQSIKADNKLKLINPDAGCLVFDNGEQVQPTEDGFIPVEFFNPTFNAGKAGNHEIEVLYTYDVNFKSTSSLFAISTPEVSNGIDYKSGEFDCTEALAPVLKNVAENSVVRFRLDFHSEHDAGIEAHVVLGQAELEPDDEGYYSVNVTNAAREVEIFAVPTDGATLNSEELAAINPDESKGITSIALAGEIAEEDLVNALGSFENLENLDLSDYEGELPAELFSGMENLVTVVLPEVEEIGANMFSGCSSLESVDIPPTVTTIGDGAFKDCESLESIRLTSIENVGEGAFEGCSSLTTITFLAGNPSEAVSAPARGKRAASGIHQNAFAGVNPNCIIVLDEGISAPASAANCILTSTGTVTETMPDGSVLEREGRIYTAEGDIIFTEGHPLSIPHAFTLANSAKVTMEAVQNAKWTGLVVPFDVTVVKNASGEELTLTSSDAPHTADKTCLIYAMPEGGEKLETVNAVEANTPYIWYADEAGTVVFSATGVTVPSTPVAITAEGRDFALNATYKTQILPADKTYLIDEDGYAFTPAGDEESTVAVDPFGVYATSPDAVSSIVVRLDGALSGIGVETVEVSDLKLARDGKLLVVYSPDDRSETLYNAAGQAVMVLRLSAGRNVVEAPAHGIYILAKVKIAL